MRAYYAYSLIGYKNKGILVTESLDNWLTVDGDKNKYKFFCISDIEKSIGCKIKKVNSMKLKNRILN